MEDVIFDNFTVRSRKIGSADEGQFHIGHARGIVECHPIPRRNTVAIRCMHG